jgi:hypothetical protein
MNGTPRSLAKSLAKYCPGILALAVALALVAPGAANAASSCGNAFLEPPEECDPPGSISCPPGSPLGAFLACNVDCTCPALPSTTTTTVTTTTVATTSTTTTTIAPCGVDLDACLDDLTCYRTRKTHGTPDFISVPGVSLVDQLEAVTATVVRQQDLCTPTDKNGEGVVDPVTHVVTYLVKRQSPKHIKRTAIRVTNQLGEIYVNTVKPDLLLVPSAKNLATPPSPPNPTATNLDHYKCYRVRVTAGTPKFASGTLVQAADQFEGARLLSLRKPRHLCIPVDKNGEGIKNPQAHYLCYTAKRAVTSPKHTRVSGIHVNNQFGPLTLDTSKESEFCIPSTKSFSP